MPCPKALGERKLTMFYAQTWIAGEPFMGRGAPRPHVPTARSICGHIGER